MLPSATTIVADTEPASRECVDYPSHLARHALAGWLTDLAYVHAIDARLVQLQAPRAPTFTDDEIRLSDI